MSTCPYKLSRGMSAYHLAEQATSIEEGEDILFRAHPELMYTNPSARAIFRERWFKNYVSELEQAVNEGCDDSSSSVSSTSSSCTSSSRSSSSSSRSSSSSTSSRSSSASSGTSQSSRSSSSIASSGSSTRSSSSSGSSLSSHSSASSSSSGESLLSLHLKRKQALRKEPRRITRSPLCQSSSSAAENKKKDVAEWVSSNCRVNASAVADMFLGVGGGNDDDESTSATVPATSATPSTETCTTETTLPKIFDGKKDTFNVIFTKLKDSLKKEAAKTGVPSKQTAEEIVSGVVSDIAGQFFKPLFGDTLNVLAGIGKTTQSEAEASTSTTTAPPAEPTPNVAAGENYCEKPIIRSHTIDLNEPFANRNESAARLIASSCIAAKKTCVWESGKPIWVENLHKLSHLLSTYNLHCKTPALIFTAADLEKVDNTIHDGLIFCDSVFLGKQYKPLMSVSKKKDILVKVPVEVSTSAYTILRIPRNIPRIFVIPTTDALHKKKLQKKCCVLHVDPYDFAPSTASTLKGLFGNSHAATPTSPLYPTIGPFLRSLLGGMSAATKARREANSDAAPSTKPTTTTTTTTVPTFDPPPYPFDADVPCRTTENEEFTVDNGLLTATITATLPILPHDNTEENFATNEDNNN